jgi:predicted dehydrogenase
MLRGGIIGFGRMGITHFSILNSRQDVQIAAICDTHSFVRKNVEKYLHVEAYSDHETMLRNTELDFAVIATPTATHKETARCALQRGLHVFVEKPFTLNPSEGRELFSLVQSGDRVNQVGYVLRFSDVFMQVRSLLESRAIGELLSFKMEMSGPTVLQDARDSWRSKGDAGGGCLCDFASHAVDLVNYLVGAPQRVAGVVLQSIHSQQVEDALCATLLYRTGVWGSLMVNWSDASYRKPSYRFEVLGRNGKIIADLHSYRVFFRSPPALEGFTDGWNQRYITDFVKPVRFYLRGFEFTRQLDYFIDCIEGKASSGVSSFASALETDTAIARIRENAAQERRSEKWIA